MIVCSFCHKSQKEVIRLISSPSGSDEQAYICNECISTCFDIISNEITQKNRIENKEITPEILCAYLDEYVISQDEAKKKLAVAVYNHYKCINLRTDHDVKIEKSNILMVGPSGVGKTYLIKTIASYLDLPIVVTDATSLTEAGYVGEDVESIIERLIQSANGDMARAAHGIVYIDEIDKKISKGNHGSSTRDVSGEGVQQSLLKLVEGSVITVSMKGSDPFEFDTSNILFICGGAFIGLDTFIKKDIVGSQIGFASDVQHDIDDILPLVKPNHLMEYGLIPEFVGRFPITITMHNLSENDLVRILTEPKNNLLSQFILLFELDDVILEFNNEYIQSVAKECITQKIGARGLRTVLEQTLLNVQYKLPSYAEHGINKIYVNQQGIAECLKIEQKKNTIQSL